jgi:hypothetical protein
MDEDKCSEEEKPPERSSLGGKASHRLPARGLSATSNSLTKQQLENGSVESWNKAAYLIQVFK